MENVQIGEMIKGILLCLLFSIVLWANVYVLIDSTERGWCSKIGLIHIITIGRNGDFRFGNLATIVLSLLALPSLILGIILGYRIFDKSNDDSVIAIWDNAD